MPQLARQKAFVLEDEPMIALDIEDALTGLGFDVAVVIDPHKVITAIASAPVALVVLNVWSDGSSGSVAAAEAARAMDVPLVLCSSGERLPGFDDVPFVDSPFSLDNLLIAVRTAMAKMPGGAKTALA